MGLLELTALELGKQIKEKKVSVKEAVEASFSRIRESEETVHAFITLEEEKALKNAEEVQARIDAGVLSGPLAGVPMAVKDNICTEGMKTTCGSRILYNFVEQIAGINGALQFRSNEVYAFVYRITFFNQFFQGSVQRNGIFANQRNGTVKAQQFKIIVCPQCTCFRFPLSTCRGGGFCTFIYVLDERTCFCYCLIVL